MYMNIYILLPMLMGNLKYHVGYIIFLYVRENNVDIYQI